MKTTLPLLALAFIFTLTLPTRAADWSAAGNLAAARNGHTATLLPGGKVLVTGGYGGSGALASAELYDPATNAWSATDSFATGRRSHTATLLPCGKVLVVGGYNDGSGSLASAELYDPATNAWSAAGSPAAARGSHTATLLPSGKVLVVGGFNFNVGGSGALASAELYDPATNAWSAAGHAGSRADHTATLLPTGKVLVVGGYNQFYAVGASAQLYDPETNAWSAADSLAAARYLHTATLLPSGKVIVAGGYNDGTGILAGAELYDPATNAWSTAGSLATARYHHTATLLPGGKVLVAGEYNDGSGILASAELYDPAADAWSAAGSLAAARLAHTATLLLSGKVLVAGGSNGSVPFASAELYYIEPDTTLAPTLTDPATGSTQAVLVAVSYSLPEAASGGTVKLTFTGPVVTTATLANALGTAGAHSFTLPSSDLASSANVASVSGPNALPDGVYSVTLQYQDAAGNPAASATSVNVAVYNDTDGDGILDRYETGTGIYVSPTNTGTSPTNPDTDGDGLSDGGEVNTTHSNPNLADTDADGFSDGFEVSTGFDPTSAASTPDTLSSIRTAAEYRFNAALGISYRIEASTDLANWTTIETNIIGTGGAITRFYSIEGQPRRFFRSRRN